ncbi:MAG: DUF362 domain-containing protein [Chloroflexi bacterium]|nr:DUF362 domain-containing protein [Chloroflexota bacterium]
MDRRKFIKAILAAGGLLGVAELVEVIGPGGPPEETIVPTATPTEEPPARPTIQPTPTQLVTTASMEQKESGMSRIALVKTADRAEGVRKAISLLGALPIRGKAVALKPNFNSADPAPGSTHNDTLQAMVEELKSLGARKITVADRSGMGNTRAVMEQKGIFEMGRGLGFDVIVLDELKREDWTPIKLEGSHWQDVLYVAGVYANAESVVQTCCLKTHRFGGHFTLSLKNAVGMVARRVPGVDHDYMKEMHGSPYHRLMIAEINVAYKPDLIVMDAVEAFADGGPDNGRRVRPETVLAGTDRIAIDAAGVAILRKFGTTPEVSRGPIFKQEQIARAVELKLGIDSPQKIEFVTGDDESAQLAASIMDILRPG